MVARVVILIILAVTQLHAKKYTTSLCIVEKVSKEPIPFVHITNLDLQEHSFADIEGKFTVEVDNFNDIFFFHKDLFEQKHYSFKELMKMDTIFLDKHGTFQYQKKTSAADAALIQRVLAHSYENNPEWSKSFQYNTYNKFTLSTGDVSEAKKKVNKILSKVKFLHKTINTKDTVDHHLVLLESATERKYKSHLNQKEVVIASRASGIKNPGYFTVTSQVQPFTIYDREFFIAGNTYYSPMIPKALTWYRFQTIDTAYVPRDELHTDTVFVVKFNPVTHRRYAFMKGYLYINTNRYAVQYVDTHPAIDESSEVDLDQEYVFDPANGWFPHKVRTAIIQNKNKSDFRRIDIVDLTVIYNLKMVNHLKAREFSEVTIDYKDSANVEKPLSFWEQSRVVPFSEKDQATYTFYDSVGVIKQFDRLLRIGEGLLHGQIPLMDVNLDLNRIVTANIHEGMRIGMGLHTNDRFSKHFIAGGYFGLGLKDNEFKYGMDVDYKFGKRLKHMVAFEHYNDLREAGGRVFAFNKKQHSSEGVRNYNIDTYDFVRHTSLGIESRLFRYLQLRAAFQKERIRTRYNYEFTPDQDQIYQFTELNIGGHLAFGDRLMRLSHTSYSLGTKYPLLWFNYTKGYKGALGGEYAYDKFLFKVQKDFKLVGRGVSSIQLMGGVVNGALPYSKLFNGKGSYREFSAVAHNSFETMYHNEFLHDRFLSLFYTHEFGKIYLRKLHRQPIFTVMHNMGIGSLRNKDVHQNYTFDTFKGVYLESGTYVRNVLVISLFGVDISMGAGVFFRYGPHHYPKFGDNLLYKFAITL